MISVFNLELDQDIKDLLVFCGIKYVKDVFLFNRKELMNFLKITREEADTILQQSLEAKADNEMKNPLYNGFLKQGGFEEAYVPAGIERKEVQYPKRGVTQLMGTVQATDIMIKKWTEIRDDILIINLLESNLDLPFLIGSEVRNASCLDEQTLSIDFLVRDVKDYHLTGIILRGFLHHTRELEENPFQRQNTIKRMIKRLERLSEAYTIPILITTRGIGGSSISQHVKQRLKITEKAQHIKVEHLS